MKDGFLRIGDKVKYTSSEFLDTPTNPLWGGSYGKIIGTIKKVIKDKSFCYEVNWENGNNETYRKSDIELIEIKKSDGLCACCGHNETTEDSKDTQDGQVCEACFNDNYLICDRCSAIYHNDDEISPSEDEFFCSVYCANRKGWYKCSDCEDWTHSDNSGNNSSGDIICNRCLENYYECSECGDCTHNDDANYQDSTGQHYCNSCWENYEEDCAGIHSYAFKPKDYVYSKMPWENTMYLGIELEVETKGDREDKAEQVIAWLDKEGLEKLVYLKEDSSLENGFEIVFHPITLQAIHKKFPMRKFLLYLHKIGLTSYEEGTCGLHVHLSKKKMTGTSQYRGKLFFYKCQSYLKKLSARQDGRGDWSDSYIFNYCKFDSAMPSSLRQEFGKYSAFNVSASPFTVELRLFRGTLKYDRFQASLQFADAFGEWIQSSRETACLKDNDGNVIWREFLEYCKKQSKWSQFLKYVNKNGVV